MVASSFAGGVACPSIGQGRFDLEQFISFCRGANRQTEPVHHPLDQPEHHPDHNALSRGPLQPVAEAGLLMQAVELGPGRRLAVRHRVLLPPPSPLPPLPLPPRSTSSSSGGSRQLDPQSVRCALSRASPGLLLPSALSLHPRRTVPSKVCGYGSGDLASDRDFTRTQRGPKRSSHFFHPELDSGRPLPPLCGPASRNGEDSARPRASHADGTCPREPPDLARRSGRS